MEMIERIKKHLSEQRCLEQMVWELAKSSGLSMDDILTIIQNGPYSVRDFYRHPSLLNENKRRLSISSGTIID